MTEKSCNLSENEWTTLENKEVEPAEPDQMNIYESNTYRKDLSWLHFNNEPYGRFIEIQSNLRRKNFIEQTKASIFLEAVLASAQFRRESQRQHLER